MQVVLLICFALVIVQLNNVSSTLTGILDGYGDLFAIFDISLKGTVSKMNNAAKNSIIRDIPVL
jgi:hypothetical protein